MLERLVLIDDRPQWRTWARKQLALGKVDAPIVLELLPFENVGELPAPRKRSEFDIEIDAMDN